MAREEGWAVVSGAGGALGRHLVARLAAEGNRVLALDQRFDSCAEWPSSVLTSAIELSSQERVADALGMLPEGADGRITLLVNAVGLIWSEPLLSVRGGRLVPHGLESWNKVISANLTAPFVVASEVARRMARTGGGAIINFSSIAAGGNVGQVAYSAAKAGIEGMTRTMAAELGPLGIRTNALALGFIDAPSTRTALDGAQLDEYARRTPVGRLGATDDVADAVMFLTKDTFVNGSVLTIDGGLRL